MAENRKAATMEEFRQTPYYQGLGIEGMQAQLEEYRQDEEVLRSQAEAEYRPAYESETEAARQALARELQGYDAQLAGMGSVYDRQRRNAAQTYEQSAVELNNQLTKRGLGRSSLVSTQGTQLHNQLGQALTEIDRAESDAIQTINEKIALLTEQAAQSERTRAENYARRLESRISEMKEQNREASISLQLQIAALQQQGYEAYQDWLLKNRQQEIEEKEFEAEYGDVLLQEEGREEDQTASSGVGKRAEKQSSGQEVEKRGAISEKAEQVVSTFAEAARKLADGLAQSVKSAAQKQTAKTESSGKAEKVAAAKKTAGGAAKKASGLSSLLKKKSGGE